MKNRFLGAISILIVLALAWAATVQAQDPDDLNSLLASGSQAVTVSEVVLQETFETNDFGWAEYAEGQRRAALEDEAYVMGVEGSINVLGFGPSVGDSLVVRVQTTMLAESSSNNHGLGCRLNQEEGTFYEFAITGNGDFYIYNGVAGEYVLEPDSSDAINTGTGAVNDLVMVCAGDYLAWYANGELLGETNDSSYAEGQVALIVSAADDSAISTVSFDNLEVWIASSEGGSTVSAGGNESNAPFEIESGEVLLEEDFSDGEAGWPDYTDAGISATLSEGVYRFTSEGEGTFNLLQFGPEADGVFVLAETVVLEDSDANYHGIGCRYDAETGLLYEFSISGTAGDFYLFKYGSEGGEYLIEKTASSAINTEAGAMNELIAVCVEDYLAFYINGELVGEATDGELTSGQAALLTYSEVGNIEVSFDNLYLSSISAAQ